MPLMFVEVRIPAPLQKEIDMLPSRRRERVDGGLTDVSLHAIPREGFHPYMVDTPDEPDDLLLYIRWTHMFGQTEWSLTLIAFDFVTRPRP